MGIDNYAVPPILKQLLEDKVFFEFASIKIALLIHDALYLCLAACIGSLTEGHEVST